MSRTFGFITNHNPKCSGRLSLYRSSSRNVIDTLLTRLLVSLSPRIRNSFRYTKLEGEYIPSHTTLYITHKNAYVRMASMVLHTSRVDVCSALWSRNGGWMCIVKRTLVYQLSIVRPISQCNTHECVALTTVDLNWLLKRLFAFSKRV